MLTVGPEEALLLEAAGGRCVPTVEDRPIDWARAVQLADWHRMAPLLSEHLRRADQPRAVPRKVLDVLHDEARRSTARGLNLQFELERVLAVLADEQIPAVLLKGAALLETVYDHPGLRPMVDLDLLVRRADVERAHRRIQDALGYDVLRARVARDDAHQLASGHHHFGLISPDGVVVVELHHRLLADRTEHDVAALWERARARAAGPPHLVPDPDDLALHVAAHFTYDRIQRKESAVGQLADLVRIAQRCTVDWAAVAERARAARVADRLYLALASARWLFGDLAPPAVVDDLEPGSFTPALGEAFVRQRVLSARHSIELEQLAVHGTRRVFPGRGALERYVRRDEPMPSLTRLRARRYVALTRRLVTEMPRPGALGRDARLSRWILTLQD
jgi:peptidoglycan/xylan/chitin deacetylase (PgdA/CDA1 family)